ncbi:MAG: MOSC domain-containing protein [Gemmatimonadaceae bacterium]
MPDCVEGKVAGLQRSSGGVPKLSVGAANVEVTGMVGDRQRKPLIHGGPARALCLYSLERIDALAAEGHPITAGAVGENVTISGIPWERVTPGSRLALGSVEVEVTSYAAPCRTIAGVFIDGQFKRIGQRRHPGWSRVYVKIVRAGRITVGDPVVLTNAADTRRDGVD